MEGDVVQLSSELLFELLCFTTRSQLSLDKITTISVVAVKAWGKGVGAVIWYLFR